jgi:hypothetical protein
VQLFLRRQQNPSSVRRGDTATLHRFLYALRQQGVVPPPKKTPLSPRQRLINNYQKYLSEERGLTQARVVNNAGFINQFLSARLRKGQLSLSQLHAPDVTSFVRHQAHKLSPGIDWAFAVVCFLLFLAFLRKALSEHFSKTRS